MDFNATIDLIIKDLQEAREIIDDLKKYQGVPVLQVELAKAKCKSAAEVIALLKQEERPKTEDRRPKTEVPVAASRKPQTANPEPETPSHKPDTASPEPDTVSPKPQAASPEPEHPVKKPAEAGTIGDSFSHLSNRFNEQLGSRKSDDDISGVLKTKPISSLTEAIGINDRFLFIREIFDGNKDAYSQAITKLENTTSITDARAVIMSYTGDNDESDAVKQLLDLVKRKLPSNE
ncbi:MAG: hypothetical protein IPJ16_15380 [Bacteroidales bacterium]|nr:hypothetical protein [Bacteroidales bacterium]